MAWTTPGTAVAGDVLTAAFWNLQVRDNLDSVLSYGKVALFQDEKAANTAGGDFTSGAWRTRVLNTTKINTITGASLSSNQVTLPSGSYFFIGRAPAVAVNNHQTRLRNTTDSSTTIVGAPSYSASTDVVISDSFLFGFATIAAQKTFAFEHQCQTTRNTNGLGVQGNFGEVEVYAQLLIWKVS